MAAPDSLYPFSSQKGDAIPLEIVRPVSLVMYTFAAATAVDITLPAAFAGTCWIYATEACVLRFSATDLPNSLVAGTAYADAMFIPADTIIVVNCPAITTLSLLGLTANGTIYINKITQWAALTQPLQSTQG